MTRISFKARHPGFCGICGSKIYPGDRITALDAPVALRKRFKIDSIHATVDRTHYTKIITTNFAHAQCAGKEAWSE